MEKHTIDFHGETFEFYINDSNPQKIDFWLTGHQLGKLLGYKHPAKAIEKIRKQHARNLVRHSQVFFKGKDSFALYNIEGMMKICCYSKQPNYGEVIDFLGTVYEGLREYAKYSQSEGKNQPEPEPEKAKECPQSNELIAIMTQDIVHLLREIRELRSEIRELKTLLRCNKDKDIPKSHELWHLLQEIADVR